MNTSKQRQRRRPNTSAALLVLVGVLAVGALGAAAAPARADGCETGIRGVGCNPFDTLDAAITTNVTNRSYRLALLYLAGTARRLYPIGQSIPGDPCRLAQPGDPCRQFVGSFLAFQALELTNAAVAGSGGYTCSSASAVADTIRPMRALYPSDLFAGSRIIPGDPCRLLATARE